MKFFEMNFLIYVAISYNAYYIRGEKELAAKQNTRKQLLAAAGCDKDGQLLEENVCINRNYQSQDPPTHPMTVYNRFKKWPKILDINEKGRIIKVELELIHIWEDHRVHINLHDLNHGKLVTPLISSLENVRLLPLSLKDLRASLNGEFSFKLWTPHDQKFHIKEHLSMKSDADDDPWGIQNYIIKLTIPLNESTPLMSMLMHFVVTVQCKFEYNGYPMDNEECNLRLGSHIIRPLHFKLFDPEGMCNVPEKIYELNGFHVSSSCFNKTKGTYQVGIDFFLKRDITKYLCQYYLPSAMIVFVSQTSFAIPLSAITARISLVVTQFLALTNIFINEQSESPAKTKFTAIGGYILISLTFVVATVMQLTALLILKQKAEEKVGSTEMTNENTTNNIINSRCLIKKIDKLSTVIFPLSFVLFNVVYWMCFV